MWPSTWFHPLLLTLLRACNRGCEKPLQSMGKEASFSPLRENLCHRSVAFVSKSVPRYVGFEAMGVSALSPFCSCCVRPWGAGSSSLLRWRRGTCCGSRWPKKYWARRHVGMSTNQPTNQKKPPNKTNPQIVLWGLQMKAWWGKTDHPVGMPRNIRKKGRDMERPWVWLHHINQ